MSKLKVYGWGTGRERAIIATTSWVAAVEEANACGMNESVSRARNYGAVTHNEAEIAVAMSAPGRLFLKPVNDYTAPFAMQEEPQ